MPLLLALLAAPVTAAAALAAAAAGPSELRARIRQNFLVPYPLPAVAGRTHRQFIPAPGVRAEAVTYATQFGQRVPAILYWPDPLPAGGKIPAFIVVNGHGGDKYAWYSFYTGITYARGGMAVLTYDQAGEGERSVSRKSGTRDHDKLQGDELMARRLAGLMITDVMQAVSYLQSRPGIDGGRIGAAGYSLGSFVLALAGAVEPRLRVCVLVGGGNLDGPGGYWESSAKRMCQGQPYGSLHFLGDRPAAIYALHAERGPLLIWNGRADNVVNMPQTQDAFFDDLRARVVARRGGESGVFAYGFTPAGSHRPYFLTRPVVFWLERELDFPRWDAAAIRALPETHILAWAPAAGVTMDRLYFTEEREGGTRAIGTGVPGLSREELSVFSDAEWTAARSELTFDIWTARARAAGSR